MAAIKYTGLSWLTFLFQTTSIPKHNLPDQSFYIESSSWAQNQVDLLSSDRILCSSLGLDSRFQWPGNFPQLSPDGNRFKLTFGEWSNHDSAIDLVFEAGNNK